MIRLDQQRQEELEPERIMSTANKLMALGFNIIMNDEISYTITSPSQNDVKFWPYSGWWSGKGIGSGRGFNKLLKALAGRNWS